VTLLHVTVIYPSAQRFRNWAQKFCATLKTFGLHASARELPLRDPLMPTDFVISLGGDATLLSAAPCLMRHRVPVLGVQAGLDDKIAVVSPKQLLANLQQLSIGEWQMQARTGLAVCLIREDGERVSEVVLARVAITQGLLKRVAEISLWVDGDFATRYRADGLIVASPTGSAFNTWPLSGFTLEPTCHAFAVSPVASRRLSDRTLVLEGQVRITLSARCASSELYVLFDGGKAQPLSTGDRLIVTAAPQPLDFLFPRGKPWTQDLVGCPAPFGDC
jgi:NAD+ kinase